MADKAAIRKRLSRYLSLLMAVLFFAMASGCTTETVDTASLGTTRLYDNDGVYEIPAEGYSTLYIDVSPSDELPFYQAVGSSLVNGEKPVYQISIYDGESSLGSADEPARGTLKIKGNGSYISYYRSFKVTLSDDVEYAGQRVFQLYKCPEDTIKITMKLGSDLFSLFDDIVSTKTEFVHLYLKDDSSGSSDFIDYGLYTMAENPGGKYLKTHGLDRNGELYEIKDFDFSYDAYTNAGEAQREDMLEYKNGSNPGKLEEMLKAVNDEENFEENFEKYFDCENYLTWLGGCCLLGNYRAGTEDFLLYSPTDSDKWYFIPMPTDEILQEDSDAKWSTPPESFTGAGWFTGSVLHYQFLKSSDNRAALEKKAGELLQILNADTVDEMLIAYKKLLVDFLSQGPDGSFLATSVQETEARINRTYEHIVENYELLLENLKKPLAFELYEPEKTDTYYTLSWQEAISSSAVTYHLKIARDLGCEDVLFELDTDRTEAVIEQALEGNLYVFLTAENDAGVQTANLYEKDTEASASVWGVARYEFFSE